MVSKSLNEVVLKPITGEWGTEGNKVQILRTTNFTNEGRVNYLKVVERNVDSNKIEKKKLKIGDIIIEKSGGSPKQPVGRVVFFEKEGVFLCNNFTAILRPKLDEVVPKYLLYILYCNHKFGFTSAYQNKTTGIINLQLPKYLEGTKIPLPPLEQQKKIAAILDAADTYRQKTKALITKYDALTQSLFLDMFGDPVRNPKGWNYKTLDESLEFLTSGSRGWAKYYSDEGSVFLRIQNVGYNELRLDDLTFVKAPDSAENRRTKVKAGDLLLTITADLGRTAVIPDSFPDANINQHLALLRLKETYNPLFVSSYIASHGGQSLFLKLDKGGVKAGLNFKDLKSYKVFDVPRVNQDKFEHKIKAIEAQKAQAQDSLAQAEGLFNSLLQKAFKGELVS